MVLSFGEVLMDCLPDKNVIGGAPFNVVTHLRRLGADAGMISKIGEDELGEEIAAFLKAEQINQFVQRDPNYKTGYVTVTFNNGQPSYEIHKNCGWEFVDYMVVTPAPEYFVFGSLALYFPHNKEAFSRYLDDFSSSIKVCDINLRVPFYDEASIKFCLENTDILKINDEELAYLAKEFDLSDPIIWLQEKYGIDKIILTKGAEGAELHWEGKHIQSFAGVVREMKDTVGAGDSFTSMFIFGLLNELEPAENLKRASDFAALICEQSGAIPTDKSIYEPFKR